MSALEVDVREAKRLLESAAPPRLIDCREAEEWAICRLPRAELLPLSSFELQGKPADLAQPILIYCHHGMRSLQAAEYLIKLGCENVRSISGGIDAWAREIDSTLPRY